MSSDVSGIYTYLNDRQTADKSCYQWPEGKRLPFVDESFNLCIFRLRPNWSSTEVQRKNKLTSHLLHGDETHKQPKNCFKPVLAPNSKFPLFPLFWFFFPF